MQELEHIAELASIGVYHVAARARERFLEAVGRVSRRGWVVDSALDQEVVAARDVDDALGDLTRREREVLALMAEGCSNAGIG
jgi:DNA-binding NarL/FixJ family response regulator